MAKNEKYLKWLRQQPCWLCGLPWSEAHHCKDKGGTAKRNYDEVAVPLCHNHHSLVYSRSSFFKREHIEEKAKEYYKKWKEKK